MRRDEPSDHVWAVHDGDHNKWTRQSFCECTSICEWKAYQFAQTCRSNIREQPKKGKQHEEGALGQGSSSLIDKLGRSCLDDILLTTNRQHPLQHINQQHKMDQTRALNALAPYLALAKSATSPRAAADLITQATSAANTYVFAELLAQPNIQKIKEDEQYGAHSTLR